MNAKSKQAISILKYASFILALMPFCVSVLAIFFMQNRIPMHYNSSGEVDRIGDNMEFLIIGVLFSATALIMAIAFDKIKMPTYGAIIGFFCSIVMAITFVILTSYFVNKVFLYSQPVSLSSSGEKTSFVCALIGAALLIFGSVTPFLFDNARYGKSVAVKLFLPLTFCISGMLTMILCLVVKNFYALLVIVVCIIICLFAAITMLR
ncbi:MAG: DUF1648 domain-containing protein, partial [Clostridia bacterium]|nr:DUF1648 domain-containing protein [Clostridia bacterium]